MVSPVVSSSFSPHVPPLSESFFDPLPSAVIDSVDASSSPPLMADISAQLIESQLSEAQLQKWQHFSIECSEIVYEPTPYGLVAPSHPSAQNPHPGSPPENPNTNKGVFTQFVQRGLSKKFREKEREYKNHLRHWEAQLQAHLLEVPKLQAEDALLIGFTALTLGHASHAYNYAEHALRLFTYNPQAQALKILALVQLGEPSEANDLLEALEKQMSDEPLGELGHGILYRLAQNQLSQVYSKACSLTQQHLSETSSIPFEEGYLGSQIDKNLNRAAKELQRNPAKNFFDQISLFFFEQTLHKDADLKPSVNLTDKQMSHLARFFNHFKNVLDLIKKHPENKSPLLNQLLNKGLENLTSDELNELINELQTPVETGSPLFKRQYVQQVMGMQLNKSLFLLAQK